MSHRVILDDANKRKPLSRISVKEALKILTNPRLWGHCILNIVALTPKGGLALYSPSIIKSLGFSKLAANALSSISYYGVIIFALIVSWASDRTRQRGLMCLVCGAYSLIFSGVQYGLTTNSSKWLKYAILTLLNSGNAVSRSVNDAWLASNSRDPKERAIGLALAVMGANLGGLAGQQLFRSDDAPRYTRGFLAVMCLYAGSMVLIAALIGTYVFANRRIKRAEQRGEAITEKDGELRTKYDL